MTFNTSDWKYAGIAALVLLGAAAFIVFVIHPGGLKGRLVGSSACCPVRLLVPPLRTVCTN